MNNFINCVQAEFHVILSFFSASFCLSHNWLTHGPWNWGHIFLQNVSELLPDYMSLLSRRLYSPESPWWDPQFKNLFHILLFSLWICKVNVKQPLYLSTTLWRHIEHQNKAPCIPDVLGNKSASRSFTPEQRSVTIGEEDAWAALF